MWKQIFLYIKQHMACVRATTPHPTHAHTHSHTNSYSSFSQTHSLVTLTLRFTFFPKIKYYLSCKKKLTFIPVFIRPGGSDSGNCTAGSECESLRYAIGLSNDEASAGSVYMDPGSYHIPSPYCLPHGKKWREGECGEMGRDVERGEEE
jgi:hypothetical protein